MFAAAIIANETILMMQGLGGMFMLSSAIYPWLLWIAAIALLVSASLLAMAQFSKQLLAK